MSLPTTYNLTEYAHGAGCGCKIAPAILEEILAGSGAQGGVHPSLLVGLGTNDDAAAFDLGDGTALIATTDFFMPIVDDAELFGRIAAANAISDVYAMGGTPMLALAILGWPVDKLPAQLAARVLQGAREICAEAGIALAGGHSIDTPEPLFGLSVNGRVALPRLKRNSGAKVGDYLFLTKALGTGLLSTAYKRKLLDVSFQAELHKQMSTLNKFGETLGKLPGIHALTDVTGFGILGHVYEVCKAAGVSAELNYHRLPLLPGARECIAKAVMPDATFRNWNAYSSQLEIVPNVNAAEAFMMLADPQTNGGLLFSVAPDAVKQVQVEMRAAGLENYAEPIGRITAQKEKLIQVLP